MWDAPLSNAQDETYRQRQERQRPGEPNAHFPAGTETRLRPVCRAPPLSQKQAGWRSGVAERGGGAGCCSPARPPAPPRCCPARAPSRPGGRQPPGLLLQRLPGWGRAGGTGDAPNQEEWPHPEHLPTASGIHPDLGRLRAAAAPKPSVMLSGDSASRGTVPTQNLSTTHSITHESGPEIAHY